MRLRVPDEGATVVHDVIRGDTRFEHVHLDDPVIARADGSVLYNFAVAIDDLDARHHARGARRGPPLQHAQAAARAGGGQSGRLRRPERPLPLYAHLPLLHGPDGKKLSKRHGAASVQELRDAGYLPEAVRNYLALLGWGAGDDETVLSTAELIERFTLERVSRNPARFDEVKLRWLNGVYIRELPVAELAERLRSSCDTPSVPPRRRADARFERAVAISQEKIQTLADFWPLAGFIFDGAAATIRRRASAGWTRTAARCSPTCARRSPSSPSFDEAAVERGARGSGRARAACKPREVYQPLRVAIAGTTISPGIFESVALLGREETLRRIDRRCCAPTRVAVLLAERRLLLNHPSRSCR